jgi:PII-like signaling protein
MTELSGDQVLIRIFIGESDKHEGKPLYQWIVELLRREKICGATVLRGVLGFGAASHIHAAHILQLSQDLPMVVEFVDTQENIDRVLAQIEPCVVDGLITSERVKVIKYGTVRKK